MNERELRMEREIHELKKIVFKLQQQVDMMSCHLMAISPLAPPEQKKNGYDMYMLQLQTKAIYENNGRQFK